METFGEVLKHKRIQAGFRSARAWVENFNQNGISMSYPNYTRIENNLVLPPLDFVLQMAAILKIKDLPKFLIQYLKQMNSDAFVIEYVEKALAPKAENSTSPEAMIGKLKNQVLKYHEDRRHTLTEKQMDAITKDFDAYLLFIAMTLTRSAIDPEVAAKKCGLPAQRVRTILSALRECDLVKEVDGAFSPAHEHVVFPPGRAPRVFEFNQRINALISSKSIYRRTIFARSNKSRMEEFTDRADQLGLEFATFEETDQNRNNELFMLSIALHPSSELFLA